MSAIDPRDRLLAQMLDAAGQEPPPSMSEAEAERVLAQVLARARVKRAGARWARPALWLASLGAAAALLAVVAPRGADRRTAARETLIRAVAEGREVVIHVVSHEREE